MSVDGASTLSIPANVTLSVYTVLSIIGKLDLVIAIELDAGRPALAKQLAIIRNDIAEMAKLERLLQGSPADPPSLPDPEFERA